MGEYLIETILLILSLCIPLLVITIVIIILVKDGYLDIGAYHTLSVVKEIEM